MADMKYYCNTYPNKPPLKGEAIDKLTDIFYAPDNKAAIINYEDFVKDYQNIILSAVNCLTRNIEN